MIQYITVGYHPILIYPLWFVPPVAGLGGLWITRLLVDKYDSCRGSLNELSEEQCPTTIAPWWLQVIAYMSLIGVMGIWLLHPGMLTDIYTHQGVLGLPRHILIYILLRLPIIAEVSTVILGVTVLLPYHFTRSRIDLDFTDYSRFGGLEPVAQLLRLSIQTYFLGMFSVTSYALAPRLFPRQPGKVLSIVSISIIVGWFAGFGLFAIPNFQLHLVMKRQKRRTYSKIRSELSSHKVDINDVSSFRDVGENTANDLVLYIYFDRLLQRIEQAREYPTNIKLFRDIGVSSLPSLAVYIFTFIIP